MAAPKAASEEKEMSPENIDGFKAIEAPKSIDLPTDQVDKDSVLFWIERSKNKNIVVYEAEQKNKSDHFNNVVGYWLDIDPEYVKANRAKGKEDDREDLNFLEKKMAYGWTVSDNANVEKAYNLGIVSVPAMKMDLITDENGVPHAIAMMNGQRCMVRRIYVETVESWMGMPKVIFVTVTGISTKDGSIQKMRKDVSK